MKTLVRMVLLAAVISAGFGVRATAAVEEGGKLRVLLITGENNHNWRETTPFMKQFLEATGRYLVDVTEQPGTFMTDAAKLAPYDVLLLNYNGKRWGEPAETNFLNAVRSGKGVSVIHAANNAFPGWEEYERLVGITWRATAGHGPYREFDVRYVIKDHPVTKGLSDMAAHPDELYHRLTPAPKEPMTVLALAFADPAKGGSGQDEPMALVKSYGKGRVFHTTLGHDLRAMGDPAFQRLVARGTEWSATGKVAASK
jgi:type 1 glutamine amidotransferase